MNSGLKKTIWLVVGGILVSALAVVWLQGQQGADGKQAVADQKARMRAAGVKTDFNQVPEQRSLCGGTASSDQFVGPDDGNYARKTFTTWAELRRLPMMTNRAPFHLAYRPLAPFTESLAQGDVEAILAVGDAEAHRRVAVVAIALKRYRGQHGDYPKSLSALAPEYLDPVPPDFIDGQPLRYRVTDDGHFVLYSIGLDGVDDGGKMSLPGPEIISKDKDGFFLAPSNVDIVWPRPAAE